MLIEPDTPIMIEPGTEEFKELIAILKRAQDRERLKQRELFVWFTLDKRSDYWVSQSWGVQGYTPMEGRATPNKYIGVRAAVKRLRRNNTIQHVKVIGPIPTSDSPYFVGDSYRVEV